MPAQKQLFLVLVFLSSLAGGVLGILMAGGF